MNPLQKNIFTENSPQYSEALDGNEIIPLEKNGNYRVARLSTITTYVNKLVEVSANAVNLTGDQTIAGIKTFTSNIVAPNVIYTGSNTFTGAGTNQVILNETNANGNMLFAVTNDLNNLADIRIFGSTAAGNWGSSSVPKAGIATLLGDAPTSIIGANTNSGALLYFGSNGYIVGGYLNSISFNKAPLAFTPTNVSHAATLTISNLLNYVLINSDTSANVIWTLDTAANIYTQMGTYAGAEPQAIGTNFDFIIDNSANAHTLTIALSSGITNSQTSTTPLVVQPSDVGHFRLYCTGVNTYKLSRLSSL